MAGSSPAMENIGLRRVLDLERLAQFAFQKLATGIARYCFAQEPEIARDLVFGEMHSAVGAQFIGAHLLSRTQDDRAGDFLAEARVRDAEDAALRDRGMMMQAGFHF